MTTPEIDIRTFVKDTKSAIKWLQSISKGTGDARPLWRAYQPKIIETVNWQFNVSADGHKRWKNIDGKYRRWKVMKGFFWGIGTKTGDLRQAAGRGALKKFKRDELIWIVDDSLTGAPHARHFHQKRPIYDNISLRFNAFQDREAKLFNSGRGKQTFIWKWIMPIINKGAKK